MFTSNRRRTLAQIVDQQRRLIQKAQADERIRTDGALEYVDAEMDGITDNYSYNNIDLCQPKNFVMVGSEDKYSIMTPLNNDGKLDLETMRKQMTEQDSARNADTRQFMQMMEQNQIKAVI